MYEGWEAKFLLFYSPADLPLLTESDIEANELSF